MEESEFRAAGERHRKKIRELARRLRTEPFLGDRIQRTGVPRSFRNLPNLFRLEPPEGWRALYTVASGPTAGTQVRIVWIGSHKRHDRLFGYG